VGRARLGARGYEGQLILCYALVYDGPCIVVAHDMLWADGDIVTGFDDLAFGETDSMLLNELFDERLLSRCEARKVSQTIGYGADAVF